MNGTVNALYLSTLLGRQVAAESGQVVGRLADLVVKPGEKFPVVTHLVVRSGRVEYGVPWKAVSLFHPAAVILAAGGEPTTPRNPVPDEVLLRRDLLDRQIVDVDGARVVRVNDLKLGVSRSVLCLTAADVGLRGMLRRLGFLNPAERLAKTLGKIIPGVEIGWEYVQPLETRLHRLTLTLTRDKLSDMHPADLAEIISQLPHQNIPAVIEALDAEAAGEAIGELEPEVGSMVLSQLGAEAASDILEEMEPDDAADILAEVDEGRAEELLTLMDAEEAEKVRELLEHEEDTAGGMMNNEFLALSLDMTASQALSQVRASAGDMESIVYSYVLDADSRPVGVLSLRDILLAPDGAKVEEIMSCNVKAVELEDSPADVYEVIVKYDLAAVPVLDAEGRMEGIVTADDVMEHFLPFALRWKQFRNTRKF